MPASTAPLERAFSQMGYIITKRNSTLAHANVEMRTVVKQFYSLQLSKSKQLNLDEDETPKTASEEAGAESTATSTDASDIQIVFEQEDDEELYSTNVIEIPTEIARDLDFSLLQDSISPFEFYCSNPFRNNSHFL